MHISDMQYKHCYVCYVECVEVNVNPITFLRDKYVFMFITGYANE